MNQPTLEDGARLNEIFTEEHHTASDEAKIAQWFTNGQETNLVAFVRSP